MKIRELHIYGYGKLENVSIKNFQDLNVFYGENEAGKSTIMSFIHSILFGFPTKQQNELRYEPKQGAKYGGQLVLELKEGKATIERVKGKAVGDVTVLLSDGRSGGEELLNELLWRIDKGLYQSIFSFNIHGLQNVHQLKGEDLGRFLFSTGTVGTERLLIAETELLKEIDSRFKPNGKKPVINEKLKEINGVHKELKRVEQKNEQYGEFLKQKSQIEETIQLKQKEMYRLQKKLQQLEEWEKLLPIVKEKRLLQSQLHQFEDVSFPIDGLTRLDQLQQLLKPLEGQMKSLNERNKKMEEELRLHEPNEQLIEAETEIQQIVEQLTLYQQMKEEIEQWRIKREQLVEKIEDIESMLHLSMDEDRLNHVNTSIFMKDKAAHAEKKQIRLQEQKLELDQQFVKEQEELERLERQIELLQEELLPDAVREENENRLQRCKRKDLIERELHSIGDKIHLLKMNIQKEKEQLRSNQVQTFFLAGLFVILTIWGLFQEQWALIVIGVLGISFSGYTLLVRKKARQKEYEVELQRLKEEEVSLRTEMNDYSGADISFITEQLERDQAVREQLTVMQIKWEQQNNQYEKILHAFETWEHEMKQHEGLLLQLGRELCLPKELALEHIHEAFLLISKLKELKRENRNLDSQLLKKEADVKRFEERIERIWARFFAPSSSSLSDKIFILREQLKKEFVNKQKYESLMEKEAELTEQLEHLTREFEHLEQEKKALFAMAQVDSEEAYRLKGKEFEKREQVAVKMEELARQLKLSSLNIDTMEGIEPQVEREKTVSALHAVKDDIQQLQQSLAEVKHQISLLEEGGAYGELLHKYRQLQSELNEAAKEWAKRMVAKEMLQKTVNRFKEDRLPSMLKKAEQYLAFLTNGNYLRILPKTEANGFLIERADHVLFEANELSQATMEQIYFSLRLALATTIYKRYPFPIIIDDSFVNFDHVRTSNVIELLKRIKDNQILLFTCHQHLLSYFQKEEVMSMDKLISRNSSISIF
ncbi:AAA family ATPase [Robertmurraya sp. DFI.2.37]|uniref:ATP-binding protein n=1 Tax=Robertmurraya sp. DFI.2.37 TaxID=3031819 RepID=UPI00178703D6|nr:AAA family ATPase [Robertmurraya sp. DFI.2.37]MDF1509295.1 AAA family ATPase [Robertmurraya sp. DFI.2.37]